MNDVIEVMQLQSRWQWEKKNWIRFLRFSEDAVCVLFMRRIFEISNVFQSFRIFDRQHLLGFFNVDDLMRCQKAAPLLEGG